MYRYSTGMLKYQHKNGKTATPNGIMIMPKHTMSQFFTQLFKSAFFGTLMGLLIPSLVLAQTAFLVPNAQQQYFNAAGQPVANGKVYYYVPNTGHGTLATIWQDPNQATPQSNPVLLNAGGSPQPAGQTYGSGQYEQVVYDSNGNVIWDLVTNTTGGSGSGTGTGTVGVLVGTIIPWTSTALPPLYLYTAGQAVSRTTYPQLLTALTFNFTVLCQSGVATISVSTTISDLTPIGAPIETSCFTAGTTVSSKSSGLLTLSTSATTTISTAAVLFPWGNGDGSTTFNVPDLRGRTILGRDNMNSSTAGRVNTTNFGSNPDSIGATGGFQSSTLSVNNIPTLTSTGTNNISVTVASLNGQTGIPTTSTAGNITGGLAATSGGTISVPVSSAASWGGVNSLSGTTSNNITVTTTGTGPYSFSILQPGATSDYIIKALPDDYPTTSFPVENANTILAGPTSGVPALPTFRALVTADLPSNGVSNSNLTQSGAATLKGNPTGSTANVQDFTIQGLTARGAPDANNDKILLYDNAAGTFKNVTPGQIASAATSGVSTLNGLTGTLNVTAGTGVTVTPSGSSIQISTSSGTGTTTTPGGRLTTSTGVCVQTSDVVAATAIYYAPCLNSYVPIFNGTNLQGYNFTSSVTDAVGLTLLLGSNWAAATLYDVFATYNGGAVVLCTVPWATTGFAGTSTRATAIAVYAGMSVNSASATCRTTNSTTITLAQYQGTYLGTFLTNGSTGQIDLKFGTAASGGGQAVQSIWNQYNQTLGSFFVQDTATSFSPTASGAIQPYNSGGANSGLLNRVIFVVGTATNVIDASFIAFASTTSANAAIGIGLNSVGGFSTRCPVALAGAASSSFGLTVNCPVYGNLGENFIQALQYGSAASSVVFTNALGSEGLLAKIWW